MAENQNAEPVNMQNLQQDAIRRARDMQARARIPSLSPAFPQESRPNGQRNSAPVPPAPPTPQDNIPHPHAEQMPVDIHSQAPVPKEEPPASNLDSLLSGGALDFLLKDSERSLILLLMLILLEEKADTTLIFGLMYLLL